MSTTTNTEPALPDTEARLLDPATGRRWHVRIVREGDRYGREEGIGRSAIHREADVLVEFYDAEQDQDTFGPRGQFVARYYGSTLDTVKGGLCLDTGVSAWAVSSTVVSVAVALARRVSSES